MTCTNSLLYTQRPDPDQLAQYAQIKSISSIALYKTAIHLYHYNCFVIKASGSKQEIISSFRVIVIQITKLTSMNKGQNFCSSFPPLDL